MNLKALVVGTGRCGTGYCSHLLTSMGLPCGHESIFTTKGILEAKKRINGDVKPTISKCMMERSSFWVDPEQIVADSSYLSAPFLSHKILNKTKIIHIIRHPLDVIGSFVLEGNYFRNDWPDYTIEFQNFIKKHLPVVYNNDFNPFDRAAIFYVEWNRMISKKLSGRDYLFHRVEDGPEPIRVFIGAEKYENISNKINSWNYSNRNRIGLNEFINFKDDIIEFCKIYNYL